MESYVLLVVLVLTGVQYTANTLALEMLKSDRRYHAFVTHTSRLWPVSPACCPQRTRSLSFRRTLHSVTFEHHITM